jgi:hypothetical protein
VTDRNRFCWVLTCALLWVNAAYAQRGVAPEFGDRRLKLIDDPLRITFMGDPDKIDQEGVREAIGVAALAKDWKIVNQSDGRAELTTLKNGKHVLHIVVTYNAERLDVNYIDSVAMMYQEMLWRGRQVRVIHRNYNFWVRELGDAVANKLGQPVKVASGALAAPARRLQHNRLVPAATDFAAIEDVDKVPVREAGKDRYRFYLRAQPPKAFVVFEKGGWRMYVRNPDAIAMALDECERVKVGCWLYAVDDRVVFSADPQKRISQLSQLPRVAR